MPNLFKSLHLNGPRFGNASDQSASQQRTASQYVGRATADISTDSPSVSDAQMERPTPSKRVTFACATIQTQDRNGEPISNSVHTQVTSPRSILKMPSDHPIHYSDNFEVTGAPSQLGTVSRAEVSQEQSIQKRITRLGLTRESIERSFKRKDHPSIISKKLSHLSGGLRDLAIEIQGIGEAKSEKRENFQKTFDTLSAYKSLARHRVSVEKVLASTEVGFRIDGTVDDSLYKSEVEPVIMSFKERSGLVIDSLGSSCVDLMDWMRETLQAFNEEIVAWGKKPIPVSNRLSMIEEGGEESDNESKASC